MKRRTLSTLNNALTALWIGSVVVAGIEVATTDMGQAATMVRGLLLTGLGGVGLLLIAGYVFRKTLFSKKPTTELTAKESAQFAVVVLLAFVCLAAMAAVAAVTQK